MPSACLPVFLSACRQTKIMKKDRFFFFPDFCIVLIISTYLGYYCYKEYKEQIFNQSLLLMSEYITSQMNDRTLLGQTFLVYLPPGDNASDSRKRWKNLMNIRPGVLFIQSSSIPQKKDKKSSSLLKKRLLEVKKYLHSRNIPPPFTATDQEFGRVQRIKEGVTTFPSAMTMGESIQSNQKYHFIYWVGFHSCTDLRNLGIDWPLAPVADLQINPENSVIGTRSFGSEPKHVSRILFHYIDGLHDAGCMDTLKHFPGAWKRLQRFSSKFARN